MKKPILVISIFIFLLSNSNYAQKVHIIGKSFPKQMRYATVILEKIFYTQSDIVPKANADFTILLKIDPDGLNEEAYSISRNQKQIEITGGDGRGVIYGCQSIVEELQNGRKLNNIMSKSESTRLHFRAIKFDLPWDTYRHSGSLYQHQEICSDLKFWEAFLDMMCKNRFNALTLWNLHPYTFLIKPKNFPEASPWTDEEMDKWKSLFHGIFKLAKERGIDTYIMPFNIFVTPEFAKAHNVAMHNLDHHHFVEGDTSEIIKRYTRECVTQMLNEYPDLTGIGLTLGEGMGGMTPQQRENWISDTIIEGMRLADRKSKLIHRIPFSGNKGSLGATNIKMEQITRAGIEREAAMDCFEGPVWASLKFNWSHPLSTTKMIKVHGGKIYGTYWNPEPVGYKMVWTARNEDIFCLRWGVADFIREHIKTNAHQYVGGYFVGSETYIPAKDYFTKPAYAGKWKYAFERQWLFYKIWGRLLYNPDTPDTVFKNEFISRYGKGSEVLFDAFSLAGKTPLRLASSFDCTWDFTLYSEGFIALDPDVKRVDYISINRQINHPPLDTTYISIKEYVNM
ncbi:MAG: glycoside hydrolase family 20 zincin-like fold domain-containing protein, partial [Calditrichaceae bacterium]